MGEKRVTVADIAARTGLSKGAVSYALNGRPGVSEHTRQRVLRAALDLGWNPVTAPRTPTGVVGLALTRPPEPFLMTLLRGMQSALVPAGTGLLLHGVADHHGELATYRRWWSEQRVEGLFLLDLCRDDPRVPALEELRLPTVVVGGPGHHGTLAGVWIDDTAAAAAVMAHLTAQGHRRIAHVTGKPELVHTQIRTAALARHTPPPITVDTDHSADQGAQATRRLLCADRPPTAIVYDSDVMAAAGLTVTRELGIDVPGDLSIVAWDDSTLCEVAALTAVDRDVATCGRRAAEHLLALLRGERVRDAVIPRPRLVIRASTARNVSEL